MLLFDCYHFPHSKGFKHLVRCLTSNSIFLTFFFKHFKIKNFYTDVINEDFAMKIFDMDVDNTLVFELFTLSFSYLIVLVQTDLSW